MCCHCISILVVAAILTDGVIVLNIVVLINYTRRSRLPGLRKQIK